MAEAVAEAEKPAHRARWAKEFKGLLEGYRFLPAGRILSGAGTGRAVTLFNCFVMGADRRFARRHIQGAQGGRAHHAAGRRHRP